MSIDLTPALDAAARSYWHIPADEYDALGDVERGHLRDVMRPTVEAAAPLIEAAVREQVAGEIAEMELTRLEVDDSVREGYSVDWSTGYDNAVADAARIARGVKREGRRA